MKERKRWRAPAGALVAGVLLLAGLPAAGYTLDELLQEPPLIGVAPRQSAWSPDGSQLAFTWNDAGGEFQDVWVYRPGDEAPRRVTHHADDAGSNGGGVTELTWTGDDEAPLAYVLDGNLYLADLDGGSTLVDDETGHIRQLRRAPDGSTLSFVSGGPATGYLHEFRGNGSLWLRPAGAGAEVDSRRILGDDVELTFVESYEWSDDGSSIAFVLGDNTEVPIRELRYYADGGEPREYRFSRSFPGDRTTRRRLGVMRVDEERVRWLPLIEEQYPIWNYGISADGSRLFANTSNYVVKEHRIYVFDTESGERELFYGFDDPQNVIPGWQAEWAPGNEGLIVQTDRDGFYHLYHVPEAGAKPRALTSGAWEVESFEVDDRRGQVWFTANGSHVAERQVYRVSMDGGDAERLTREPGTWSPVFSADYSRVALDFSSDTTPPDLYIMETEPGSEPRRVTHSPRTDFASYDWATVLYPEFESHVDGMKLYGRLSVPPDFDRSKRYPMIVGSVYANTVRNEWTRGRRPLWAFDEYLVSNGYLVLKVNVRGSWGQGKAFSQGLIRDYGGIDTDDIESGVRHLVAEGFVDADRVGIWGNSYGGLMTLMSLFKKPGVYAAGIAGAPATNVWHAYPSQMWVMGERRGDDYPERYRRQSALYQSAGLADPLMIIHGTRDPIVLYSDTIALVEKLIDQGKMFELVTLPAASHGWAADNPAQTRFAFRKMAMFFDRHVRNRKD